MDNLEESINIKNVIQIDTKKTGFMSKGKDKEKDKGNEGRRRNRKAKRKGKGFRLQTIKN